MVNSGCAAQYLIINGVVMEALLGIAHLSLEVKYCSVCVKGSETAGHNGTVLAKERKQLLSAFPKGNERQTKNYLNYVHSLLLKRILCRLF